MGGTARNPSPAVAATPRAGTMDGQLRIAFRQITRNGCMGLDQAAFVGAHFGIDSKVIRRVYKETGGGTALTEQQFLAIVQKALTEAKGGYVDMERKNTQNPMVINKNEAMLHRGLAVLPNYLPLPAAPPKDRGDLSPTKSIKHPTRASQQQNQRMPLGATSRNRPGTGASRPGTSASVR
eukprot:CAMPEP_0173461992 /NCGR_PEP_ID=MMETSP1357-20121228/65884_1 /TAXON_ID=77926 /ORGANISM="Hemiselmis rufescens, Strain PCC563" /LENGTH=179 /DNA_ID=CAMNT_0014429695 /DNA_START=114 /DNA_END=649 /DNA_ORIENTATION=+